jgi:hypothetical protein
MLPLTTTILTTQTTNNEHISSIHSTEHFVTECLALLLRIRGVGGGRGGGLYYSGLTLRSPFRLS